MKTSNSDPFENIGPYLTDATLLRNLGLPNWTSKLGVETHIGDVRPFVEDEPADQQTIISIYVKGLPAQVFRFEILRRSEHFDGTEKIEVRTGSGSLETYWGMALAIASNMLVVSTAERVSPVEATDG